MRRFAIGFACGVAVTAATMAGAAGIVGKDGYLMEYEVTKDNKTICTAPFVWVMTKEIECDD